MKEDYFEFILAEVERFKKENRFSSCRIWRNALRTFRIATGLNSLFPGQLTRHQLLVYKEWLLRREFSTNTIKSYLGALQAAYNRMTVETESHVYGLFRGLRPGSVSTVKRAVSERTMARLLQTDPESLPKNLRRPFVCFLLLFYLRGMPFVDLVYLRKSDLRDGSITYHRRKTGRELAVKVPKEALILLKKYATGCIDSPFLLPILEGKEDTPEAIWRNYQCALRRFNFDLESLSVLLRTDVRLSSYTARHSWATIAYHRGMAVGLISKALGHSSIRVTEFYLKPFENSTLDKENRQMIKAMKKGFDANVVML